MILALLLACRPPAGDTATPGGGGDGGLDGLLDGGAAGDSGGAWTRPAFVQPAEAEDLDPDPGVVHVRLRASAWTHEVEGPDGLLVIEGYAYEGQSPGPTIRASLGDTLVAEIENDLEVPTTVHWHGLDVPVEMDGVPGMVAPVAPGESFTARFVLEQAGTFWYHPHFDSARQVDLGLYGVVVVADPAEPAADLDVVAVADDWSTYMEPDSGWQADPTEAADAHGEHGDEGLWTVNGLHQPLLAAPAGSSVRLRLLNASNTGYLDLRQDAGLRLLATDQGLLPAAQAPARLLLAPGDRAELEWSVGEEGWDLVDHPYAHHGGEALGEPMPLLGVAPQGAGSAPAPLALPWPGGAPTADPGDQGLVYVFSGDTATGDWFINGEQWPDVSMAELPLGAEAVIEVRNLSPTLHPFHLHGMSFEVLSVDGVVPAWRTVEDTVDVGLYSTVRLRLVADNPGDWMLHCHILPHADGGMMTMLRVVE